MEKFDLFLYEQNFQGDACIIEEQGATMSMYEEEEEYVVRIDREMPCMVSTVKTYYADTLTLKTVGDCLKQGDTKIGVWKTYDEFGELIEEIDYDEGWKINWEQLQPILLADRIDFKSIANLCRIPDKDDAESPEEEPLEEDSPSNPLNPSNPSSPSEEEASEDEEDYEEEEDYLEEENYDEESPFDEDDEEDPEPAEEQKQPQEYDHVWKVSVIATPKLVIDAIYDGDTGERVGTEFNSF